MQDAGGRAFWNVACSNGNSYYIRINADKDGTSEISDCAQIKRLAGRACFDKVKDIPSGWRGGE
jgi:ribosome maturation factor RimP